MKKMFVAFALVAFAASFTSCKKCGTCVINGVESSSEICQKDNKLVYDATKAACKDAGGKWE